MFGVRARCLGVAVAVVLLAIGGVPDTAVGENSQARTASVDALLVPPNDRFGLNRASFGLDTPLGYNLNLAAEAGALWNRWPLYWYLVESEDGLDYTAYDRAVAEDLRRGTSLDLVLLGTPPSRASGENPHGATPENLETPIFADGTDEYAPGKAINPENHWARFVSLTVRRYKPNGELHEQGVIPDGVGVRHWEIWNEPDVSYYWYARGPGTEVGDYFRLLKVAYLAAKSADPGAKIVLGGLSYWGSEDWITRLIQAIKADPDSGKNGHYFDVMAWHVYSRAVDLYNRASWSRHLLRDHGITGKQVWINETNIPVWGDPTPERRDPGTHRGNPEEQAAFILQAYAYGFAGGADRIFTFMLYDDCWQYGEHYGLVRNPPGDYPIEDCASDGRPRPAYTAYKIAAAYLRDITASRVFSHGPGGQVDTVQFDTASGARVTVILNKFGHPVTVDLPVRGRAHLIDQDGSTQMVRPNDRGRFSLSLPGATANDAREGEEPFLIVGSRTYVLVEPAAATASGQLLNGGFEMQLPLAAWVDGGKSAVATLAKSGERSAFLQTGPDAVAVSWLSQSMLVPDSSRPRLSFSYAVHTAQPAEGDGVDQADLSVFEVTAQAPGEPEKVLLAEKRATNWVHSQFELPEYAGKLLTLRFRVRGEEHPLAVYVDDVAFWALKYRLVLPIVPNKAPLR